MTTLITVRFSVETGPGCSDSYTVTTGKTVKLGTRTYTVVSAGYTFPGGRAKATARLVNAYSERTINAYLVRD